MSTLSYALTDSATMLRRHLRHLLRYPSMTLMLTGMPIVVLLLFVYVFGGTLGARLDSGVGSLSGGRADYVNYVTPGILLMTVAAAAQGTAISVAMDMTEGLIARFRTMDLARVSMPTGLRWFAAYLPFTPITETLRGLLIGTPIGNSGLLAVGWCAVIALGGYLWAKKLYDRDPVR